MKPQDAFQFFKAQTRIAEICGVPDSNVSRWFAAERIPIKHQAALCIASEGKLKLGRADLLVARALAALWSRAVELST